MALDAADRKRGFDDTVKVGYDVIVVSAEVPGLAKIPEFPVSIRIDARIVRYR